MSPLFAFLAVALGAGLSVAACGASTSHGASVDPDGDASVDRSLLDAAVHLDASCAVTIDAPPLLPAVHVAIGSSIDWDSNPPSSGPHYPIWAAFQTFASPVPRGYYVHDLEHGAIVLLYRCDEEAGAGSDGGGCPEVVAALESVVAALPDDPLCTSIASSNGGVRVRAVITPDPLLDVPIAAAAWGFTYKADCVDLPTLNAFASEHYGKGTEDLCGNGQTLF